MDELQAIQYLTEVAKRRFQAATDSETCGTACCKSSRTRNAVGSCRSLAEWLRPTAGATTAIEAGIAACLKLAGDDWRLRGIEATTHLHAPDAQVERGCTLRDIHGHAPRVDRHAPGYPRYRRGKRGSRRTHRTHVARAVRRQPIQHAAIRV